MTKSTIRTSVVVALITSLVLTYQACGQATSFSNEETLQKDGYGGGGTETLPSIGGTTTDNPKATVNLVAMSFVSSEVSSIDLCVKELRFKSPSGMKVASVSHKSHSHSKREKHRRDGKDKGDCKNPQSWTEAILCDIFGSESSRSAESTEDLVAMSPSQPEHNFERSGSSMEQFEIPVNTYTGVEIDLSSDCAKGALTVNKEDGSKETSKEKDLTLKFEGSVAIKNSGDLKLDLQNIVKELEDADCSGDIEDALEKVKGTIQ